MASTSDFEVKTSDFAVIKREVEAVTSDFEVRSSDFEAETSDFAAAKPEVEAVTSDFRVRSSDFQAVKREFQIRKRSGIGLWDGVMRSPRDLAPRP
ncbi:MAG TPA: hypothetical protein VEW65_07940 [Chryseolinea sp.]|nr:hypothetical protein [Chryseolinea sp.]